MINGVPGGCPYQAEDGFNDRNRFAPGHLFIGEIENGKRYPLMAYTKTESDARYAPISTAADVTSLQTAIAQKANQDDLDSLEREVEGKAAATDLAATNAAVALKADAATVTAALAEKANAATVEAALTLKANTADVTAQLSQKADSAVVTAELATKANAADVVTALSVKADTSAVNAMLATKANAADVDAALELKADVSDVENALAGKADTADVEAALEGKADMASVNAAVANKADAADILTLQEEINQIVISASAEAVVAPEVAAARVDENGESFDTLKARLDSDASKVTDIRSASGKNLYNRETIKYSTFLNSTTGEEEESTLYNASDFIAAEAGTSYIVKTFVYTGTATYRIYFYNSSHAFISRTTASVSENSTGYSFQTPAGTSYIRILFESSSNTTAKQDEKTCVLNEGTSAIAEYAPYYTASDTTAREHIDAVDTLAMQSRSLLAESTDLNAIATNGVWMITTARSSTISHLPEYYSGKASWLISTSHQIDATSRASVQLIIGYSAARVYQRSMINNTTWTDWIEINNASAVSALQGIVKDGDGILNVEIEHGLPSCDLDTVTNSCVNLLMDASTYTNAPEGVRIGFLISVKLYSNWVLQLVFPFTGDKMYKRRGNATTGVWEIWREISGSGGGGTTNNYKFEQYYATNEITATPTITTDTNGFLASTGDTTDRTADIIAILSATGICRLGKGEFYVKNVIMPNNTMITGCGSATVLRLISGNGCAIKPGNYCTIKDIKIDGGAATVSETVGSRHGILWQGNYTEVNDSASQPIACVIDGVYINGMSGGGIACYDTGYGTYNCIQASNCYISNCDAGIYIPYWSEFHKFTNVRAYFCYYGAVNNGGNNNFVNCDFSKNAIGFLMDNSQSQSPNNSHGSAIGCVFNHSGNNSGTGIKIMNCDNGYVFSGCQIFFSKIEIEDSDGVSVCNSNFGSTNCDITISGGGVALFANNLHGAAPTISVTSNNKVHFANCFVRSTGESVDVPE